MAYDYYEGNRQKAARGEPVLIVDRFYYGKLPDDEKQIYREIYQGCMAHKDIIPISASEEEIVKSYARIIQALMDDNPLLYFLNQSMIDFARDANGNYAVMPQYFFSEKNVAAYNQKIQDAANKIIYDLKLTEGSDLEKARKVHDYMCRNIAYDYGGANTKDISRFISAHNIIGVFAHQKAQCEGIAKAAKVLLNAVDVRCIVIFGQAKDTPGVMEDHCWNMVNIGGKPYHMDITFDIGVGSADAISFDYYNITDSQIRKDHVFSTGFPKCTEKQAGYFEQEGLVFASKKMLRDYISRQVKNGAKMVYFKLAGKLKVRDIANEITEYALQQFCDTGLSQMTGDQTINEAANTCRISFR